MILSDKTKKSPRLVPFSFGASSRGWHAIESFIRCPKEYQFSKVRQVQPRTMHLPEPLSVGLLIHAARAQYLWDMRDPANWEEAVTLYAETFPLREKQRLAPNAIDIAMRTFREYVRYWKVRPAPRPLAVEHEIKPKALIDGAPPWAWRGARLDSVERWQGKAWIGEAKTTSSSWKKVNDTYLLHGQTMLQAALWGREETERFGPLGGILMDVIVKPSGKKEAQPQPRVAMPIEKMQTAMKWFVRDFTTWVMQTHLVTWDATVERKPNCMRAYGPCDYRDLCLYGKKGTGGFVVGDARAPLQNWTAVPGKSVSPWE